MKLLEDFTENKARDMVGIGVVIAVHIGLAGFFMGRELALLFYLFPIVLVPWFVARNLGLVLIVISAIIGFTVVVLSGETYLQPIISWL